MDTIIFATTVEIFEISLFENFRPRNLVEPFDFKLERYREKNNWIY